MGFVGGEGYRAIGAQRRGAYAAFLIPALAAALALALFTSLVTARTIHALSIAWRLVPEFTITGSQLHLPKGTHSPVRVSAGGAVIVLDSSSNATDALLGNAPIGLLLTGDALLIRDGAGREGAVPVAAFGTNTVTKSTLGTVLRSLSGPLLWAVGGMAVGSQLVRDLIRAVIVAWIGLTLARLGGYPIVWPQAWRVGLASWTLPLLAEVGRIWVPYPAWALWVVASIYAITGCRRQGDAAPRMR